jgi:ankyrin repeat protein
LGKELCFFPILLVKNISPKKPTCFLYADQHNLLNKNKINIHSNNEQGFISACMNGHIHIVEYLINLYKNDIIYTKININNGLGFQLACAYGHLNIVKYLVNLYKNNQTSDNKMININNNRGFICACKTEHQHIITYLMKLYKTHKQYNKIIIDYNKPNYLKWYNNYKYFISCGCYSYEKTDNSIIIL